VPLATSSVSDPPHDDAGGLTADELRAVEEHEARYLGQRLSGMVDWIAERYLPSGQSAAA